MSPLPPVSPLVSKRSPRLWSVGSLTYTTGGLVLLFCWLLCGDFAWVMKDRAIIPLSQIMLRAMTAPDWLIGLLVGSVPAALGLVLGPLVSLKSDSYRSRWGRRLPFLLFPMPLVVLSMVGIAFTPQLSARLHLALAEHSPGLFPCRIIVFAFFWTSYEIATITIGSLYEALINDVVPRAILGRFFALFRAVSLLAGVVFNFGLMGYAETHTKAILLGMAALCGLGFTAMCLKVKEGTYPPPEPRPPASPRNVPAGVLRYFRECFTDRYYLLFFAAASLGRVAFLPVNAFAVFHARSVGLSDAEYGRSVAYSYLISMVLAYPLGILADRFHPLRVGLFAMAGYIVVSLAGFRFATTASTFFALFIVHTVVAGTFENGTASIAQRMLPVDKFAQFFSALSLVRAVAFMIVPPVVGVIAEARHHDYRYAFLLGTLIAAAGVVSFGLLLRIYQRRGGDAGFVPPAT